MFTTFRGTTPSLLDTQTSARTGVALDWLVLALAVLGVGLGLPLLGGWMYLMRTRDLKSRGWEQQASLDVPTMVNGTVQDDEGTRNIRGAD